MFIYQTAGTVYRVIEDTSNGETHIDLGGDFDGRSLGRLTVDGDLEMAGDAEAGEAVKEHFGVSE